MLYSNKKYISFLIVFFLFRIKISILKKNLYFEIILNISRYASFSDMKTICRTSLIDFWTYCLSRLHRKSLFQKIKFKWNLDREYEDLYRSLLMADISRSLLIHDLILLIFFFRVMLLSYILSRSQISPKILNFCRVRKLFRKASYDIHFFVIYIYINSLFFFFLTSQYSWLLNM